MTLESMQMDDGREDTMQGRFLTFDICEETFGIGIRYVTEIIGIQPIKKLPEAPAFVKGIINLRGKIIPVIDMRLRLSKAEIGYTDRTCIVVVETQQISAGLIVDSVSEVMAIEDKSIEPPPLLGEDNGYLSGIGKVGGDVKLLLDCEALFAETKFGSHTTKERKIS